MSSLRHPVGPEKPVVYWRRRALVLGALVVIVVVVVLIVVGRGSASTPTAAPTQSPSASAGGASTAGGSSTGGGSSAGPSRSASAAPSGAAADGATCSKDQVVLTPVLDKQAYGPTEDPKIAMSIENSGTNSCHLDLGSAQQVLTISSGEEQYWSSKDCQTGGTNQDVTIKAGQTLTTPAITWDRTRSSSTTCDASRPAVSADGASYHLEVAVGNLESKSSVQFILQ
ncbi:hypothetical protein [Curtobacterium sp. VKM Ac-1393]|uniref:hypothetical protein n=1 Tax=Curtobacterium sp. VKM Ac-1393 TaxID=2783814 RepID=UPI00188ADB79|nr:hypothetical protein [Curtobacterium sp. VKM Ac-1393]MBF4606452.1 hypothetical protein [Curtobacterium sp. VKM Ac-1393]